MAGNDWLDDTTDWPVSAERVRLGEGYTLRTVQLWAAKNGVRATGNRGQYQFFKADVLRFRKREHTGPR
jgi:hypothetical protein